MSSCGDYISEKNRERNDELKQLHGLWATSTRGKIFAHQQLQVERVHGLAVDRFEPERVDFDRLWAHATILNLESVIKTKRDVSIRDDV